jgi:hypothetical protein
MARDILREFFDAATLTDQVVGPIESEAERQPLLGERFAPLFDTPASMVSMRITSVQRGAGLAQYRSPDGQVPLVDLPGFSAEERLVEFANIDEKYRISSREWELLNSPDNRLAGEAAFTIVERLQFLERRNRNRTEKLRWDMVLSRQTVIPVDYGNATMVIDYPTFPGLAPVASVEWDVPATADGVADLRTWSATIASRSSSGEPGMIAHIPDLDVELLLAHESLRDYVPGLLPDQVYIPTLDQVANFVRPGFRFEITASGWTDMASPGVDNRYLPLGKLLLTTVYNSQNGGIADYPNGRVEIKPNPGAANTVFVYGAFDELQLDGMDAHERFVRHGARRLPRLKDPGAFLAATTHTP